MGMRYMKLEKIRPGTTLAVPVVSSDGRVLVQRGSALDEYVLGRLKREGCLGAYVADAASEGVEPALDFSVETKLRAVRAVEELDIAECAGVAGEIVDALVGGDELIRTSMELLGAHDECTCAHSFNVAVYAGSFGMVLGYPYEKLKNLVLAGLLHDIGKAAVDEAVLNKPGRLTAEERDKIESHPRAGYEMLKGMSAVPSVVRVAVLEHHENCDGSGYPMGYLEEDTHDLAKAIHICDVYDAMVSKRSYKGAYDPREVLEYMEEMAGKMFSPGLVRVFVRNVVAYPEGISVRLSDGREAFVCATNRSDPSRPVVRVSETGEEIDLGQDAGLQIEEVGV